MNITVFDTRKYDRTYLEEANQGRHRLAFLEARLTATTANLAAGSEAIVCFVNDKLDAESLQKLSDVGVRMIALRSAGFNHVDLESARKLGIAVTRVPEYSPHAVAEHAVALLLTLNRKIHRAYNRVHELNFSLEGLVGFDLHGKIVGVVGTGKIGRIFSQIMRGFGCEVLAYDTSPEIEWASQNRVTYTDLDDLFTKSDIISLHVPLNAKTKHIVSADRFASMKENAFLINTGRGALIETKALIAALKAKKLGGACLDVYEEEEGIFFSDHSEDGIADDTLARLTTFPNVLITAHQAFLTKEALKNIADTTIASLNAFEEGRELPFAL